MLPSSFNVFLQGRRYIVAVFIIVCIAIVGTFVLSHLVSEEVNALTRQIGHRSFTEKYLSLSYQFERLQEPLDQVASLADNPEKIKLLHSAQFLDSLISSNWLYIKKDSQIVFSSVNTRDSTGIQPNFRSVAGPKVSSIIYDQSGKALWRNEIAVSTEDGIVHYGFDLELKSIHRHLQNVGDYSQSYAYIFDQDGTCILHPQMNFIGRNVFNFAPLTSQDTGLQKRKYTERKVTSEYLAVEVINHVQEFRIGAAKWYISINFPISVVEPDMNVIKIYTFGIYLITTFLILSVFAFFALRLKYQYKEKVQLQKEKAELALEKEVFEKKSAFFQLQQLKNQINPHLLFNSLNTLYTLIDKDQELTKQFTFKLSRMYRYLTDRPEDNVSRVKEELEIVREFLFMQKIRHGERLRFTLDDLPPSIMEKKVPYLAVQTVVENAIKHNRATLEEPLDIHISVKENLLVIRNNYRKKKIFQETGGKFGLRYLRSIYEFYKCEEFTTYIEGDYFICELPMLEK